MNIKTLTPDFAVTTQIQPSDLPLLKAQGFMAVICNRPDGEDPGQPPFAEIAAAAAKLGIKARHIPVRPDAINPDDVAAFRRAIAELPGPVLGYCRSGGRSAAMWEKSRA
jgi:sulfide:quinone oxidoreductase